MPPVLFSRCMRDITVHQVQLVHYHLQCLWYTTRSTEHVPQKCHGSVRCNTCCTCIRQYQLPSLTQLHTPQQNLQKHISEPSYVNKLHSYFIMYGHKYPRVAAMVASYIL